MTSQPPGHNPPPGSAPRVAITGSSGFLGSALAVQLRAVGFAVHRVRRASRAAPPDIAWNPEAGVIDGAGLDGVDAVVNLAGAPLAQRWTSAHKQRIRDSRVHGTTLLARTLAGLRRPPRVFLSGSAIGVYGDRGNEELDERSSRGSGFLADVAAAWEDATEPARKEGIRVVLLRTGLVMSPGGGPLAKMLLPYKLGLGGRVGSGSQWMSWIALTDWVRATLFLLRVADGLTGPVNLVAPAPVTNEIFGQTLASVLHRPAVVPLPSLAVELLFGEMGGATLLAGQRVRPRQLLEAGFTFAEPSLEGALRHELESSRP